MPPRVRTTTATSTVKQDGGPTITAAATVWDSRKVVATSITGPGKPMGETDRTWQTEIWALMHQIPELSFYLSWHHNAGSRVRLRAVKFVNGAPVDIEGSGIGTEVQAEQADGPMSNADKKALDLVSGFAGGPAGASNLMARCVAHIASIGETYTVIRGDGEQADAYSPGTEIRWSEHEGWETENDEGIWLPVGDGLVTRGWEPDLSRRRMSWSPLRAALPVLRELAALTQLVGAEADSRLSAGLLLWPQSHVLPSGLQGFIDELISQLSTPISDRASASSVVPLPIPMPDDAIDKVRHIRFGMDLSEQTHALRDESVRRFAMGARIPPEILTGTGDISHWGQWFIDEQGIKLFIAPEVHIVLHSWTMGWLRPALVALGVDEEEAKQYAIWPDFTPLVLRPDRSSDAVSLYDRLLLSGEAVLRETGFDVSDMPTDEEKLQQLIVAVARTAPTSIVDLLPVLPGITPEIARMIGMNAEQREGRPSAHEQPMAEGGGEPEAPVDDGSRPV